MESQESTGSVFWDSRIPEDVCFKDTDMEMGSKKPKLIVGLT